LAKHPVPKVCAVCGEDTGLVAHHLRPRVLGGGPTIWLCGEHHGFVHGTDWPADLGSLSRIGREREATEQAEYRQELEQAEAAAYALGVPLNERRKESVIGFFAKLDQITAVLGEGQRPADIYRALFAPSCMSRSYFGALMGSYIYRPLRGAT